MSESQVVLHERRGQALWITLNRPDKRNAINAEVLAGVRAGYERAHADPEARAIVLTAIGDKAFCAGADLAPGKGFAFDFAQPTTAYADLLRLAQNSTLPSIAAVNGVCMAGGMGLLAMTDMAVAATTRCSVCPR
jgi:enoyl-CoA hydratase/carnithine racemase